MPPSKLTERAIINTIVGKLDKMPDMQISFGDDVSAIRLDGGKLAVLASDMLVQSTDVPTNMNHTQAARKAVIMTISDFASKGVRPLVILTSIGLPKSATMKEVEKIGEGLNMGAKEYGTHLIGGDTNETNEIVIDCLGFGLSEDKRIITRRGAHPNDILATTGLFGNAPSGLRLILERLRSNQAIKNELLAAVYEPKARLSEGIELANVGGVTSSIDSSDGLARSLAELSKMNEVGFEVNMLPITSITKKFATLNKLDEFDLVFYGGEEYEIIATVTPKAWNRLKNRIKKIGGHLYKIGKVTKSEQLVFKSGGVVREIEDRGWQHFANH